MQAKESIPVKVGSLDLGSSFAAELKKLQVVKVEKTEKRKNGDLAYRLRLRTDPAAIAKSEKARLAEIAKMPAGTAKTYALAAAKKDFAEQREDAKHMWFAATVNATKKALERLELVGWSNEATAATRSTPAAARRTDIKLGVSLWRDGDWEVVKPANSLDLKDVVTNLMAQAMRKSMSETQIQPAVPALPAGPAMGLTHEFIESSLGYKIGYPDDWASRLGENSLTLTAKYKEDGIPPELAVWSYDPIQGVDEDKMVDALIGEVRDALLVPAVEENGWTYTLEAPEAVTAKDSQGGVVPGKAYLMKRNTALGVVVTHIAIYPNFNGAKYLAVLFHEPLVPSAELAKVRDAMLDSFTILNLAP